MCADCHMVGYSVFSRIYTDMVARGTDICGLLYGYSVCMDTKYKCGKAKQRAWTLLTSTRRASSLAANY